MDRRRFLRAAVASTGSVAVGGCLDDSDDVISESREGPQRYSLPPYSVWPPAESHATGGVSFIHLALDSVVPIEAAVDDQPGTDGPLFDLPVESTATVFAAVETLSTYPFAARLREAVNSAAAGGVESDGSNTTVVDPLEESVGPANATSGNDPEGNTTSRNTTSNTTRNSTGDMITDLPDADGLGSDTEASAIEVTELTLTDDVLLFHGSYDQSLIADRYTAGFEQVDEQRGVQIYEETGDQGTLAFGVSSDVLIVPTEDRSRESPAETVLAHSLSGYINTLGRVVDDENGEWLFETTGPAALSLGVWGTTEPLSLLAEAVGTAATSSAETAPVFGGVEQFVTALAVTTDNQDAVTGFETRFAGLFPASESLPTDGEIQTLVGEATSMETFRDQPRLHLTAVFGEP